MLEVLHREIDQLLLEHGKTQNIRLDAAYRQIPQSVLPLHPAAAEFWTKERSKVRIATGNLSGRYYRFGRALQHLLEQRGVATRAIHTAGSLQNLRLLDRDRPTLALVQYDVALAARWNNMEGVYGFEEEGLDLGVEGLRRIPTLGTRAVLVANDQLTKEMAKEIANTMLEGLDFLPGDDLKKEHLAAELPSLPLHPGAREAYEEAGLLPSEPRPDWLPFWLNVTWKTLASIVILIALAKGLLKLRRDGTANWVGRRVNHVSLDSSEPHSVEKLRAIQNEIRSRVARRGGPGEPDAGASRGHPRLGFVSRSQGTRGRPPGDHLAAPRQR